MTPVALFLGGLCLILLGIIILACSRIETLMHEETACQTEAHAKCMALVTAFVGDQFAAKVLDATADALDGMDGQAELTRVAHTLWAEDGPSVPVLWLRERAEGFRHV